MTSTLGVTLQLLQLHVVMEEGFFVMQAKCRSRHSSRARRLQYLLASMKARLSMLQATADATCHMPLHKHKHAIMPKLHSKTV